MTSKRFAAGVVLGLTLIGGCASAPSVPPAATLSGGPSMTPAATQHVVAGPVSLDVPAAWHVRQVLPNPSGNVTFAFLGPAELPSECRATDQGGAECSPWPITQLAPGGIVVAVRLHGMPGSEPPEGGEPTTVGGLPARRIDGLADEECRAIGGSEQVVVVVPSVDGTAGWTSLDACLAGGDVAAAHADLDAILASVTFEEDATSVG